MVLCYFSDIFSLYVKRYIFHISMLYNQHILWYCRNNSRNTAGLSVVTDLCWIVHQKMENRESVFDQCIVVGASVYD